MKKVRRVRKFQIQKGNSSYNELKDLCLKSRNMYNYTLFILRHLYFASFPNKHNSEFYLSRISEDVRQFIESESKTYKSKKTGEKHTITLYNVVVHSDTDYTRKISDEKALYRVFTINNQADYRAIMTSAARGAVKMAYKAMKSYNTSFFDWLKNPSKYLGKPKLPDFKKDDSLIPFSIDNFNTHKDKSITINGNVHLETVYIDDNMESVKQIRVVPKMSMGVFEVEIVYEKNVDDIIVGTGWMGIDIGINNICAITTDNGNGCLINGKPLKGINHFYNKNLAELNQRYSTLGIYTGKKRRILEKKCENKIDTFMHQTSCSIVDFAKDNGIGHIVIGHNAGWKQKCNIGKKNNQKFIQIPFNKLISQIRYKAEEYGIEVIEKEEGYTSKCSALDNEDISKHENYIGKRGGKHNKEFITGKGKLINADINGSLNILRLGMKDSNTTMGKPKSTILTPPKFNKIGKDKMQSQNLLRISEDMVENDSETKNSLKIQATVDSHNMEKSTFKKYIHSHM